MLRPRSQLRVRSRDSVFIRIAYIPPRSNAATESATPMPIRCRVERQSTERCR